jgi:hypothetical protein
MKTNGKSSSVVKRAPNKYPRGWTKKKIQELAAYYDNQSETDAVAEAETAFNDPTQAVVLVPQELVPQVQRLIARHGRPKQQGRGAARAR